MADRCTLRIMEARELKSFKALINVENKRLLEAVIKQYCGIGICNYTTISMMYTRQLADSKKETNW